MSQRIAKQKPDSLASSLLNKTRPISWGSQQPKRVFAPCSTGQVTESKKEPKEKGVWMKDVSGPTCTIQGTEPSHLDGGPSAAGCKLVNSNLGISLKQARNQHDAPTGPQTLAFLPNPWASWIQSPLSNLILSLWLQWWMRSKP